MEWNFSGMPMPPSENSMYINLPSYVLAKSGNKRLGTKTSPAANRLSTALRMAAQSLTRVEFTLGGWCRRMRAKLGPAAATTATAHRIACIRYPVIKNRLAYDPAKLGDPELLRLSNERALRKQAAAFGFSLPPLLPQTA
jgi:hypothetical protein